MKQKTTKLLSALAIGVSASVTALPAHADEMSDLKALIGELKSQINEQKAQVKELKAEINTLNAQITDQKKQVTDQSAQVQSQSAAIQKVEAQQQVLEQKQVAVAAAPVEAKPATQDGYFAVPGTNSQIKIGGYVKLDVTDDVSSRLGNNPDASFTSIPLSKTAESHRNGQVDFTARETRFNLTSLTQSNTLGEIKGVVEGDFYGNESSQYFRLRHAYFSAAGFTAGQTWSTFMDLDTGGAETLDFSGPVGYSFTRQAQLRYTAALPAGSLDVAIERPSGSIAGTSSTIDRAPDVVARYTIDPSWGHVAIAGLGRYLTSDTGVSGANQHASKLVYGVLAGVGVKTFGKDMATIQTVDGNGVGSYVNDALGDTAYLSGSKLTPINVWGGTVGYTHYWNDILRSNVSYGYDHFSTPVGYSSVTTPIKSLTSVHANIIWSPADPIDVGLEYIYGHIDTAYPVSSTTGTSGSASRVQGSVKYTF